MRRDLRAGGLERGSVLRSLRQGATAPKPPLRDVHRAVRPHPAEHPRVLGSRRSGAVEKLGGWVGSGVRARFLETDSHHLPETLP